LKAVVKKQERPGMLPAVLLNGTFFLSDDLWPIGVEEFAAWLVGALVGVGTEEVALRLE